MKTKKIFIAAAILLVAFGFTKQDLPQVEESESAAKLPSVTNKAFKAGEVLNYKLHYGVINAGTAKLEVKKSDTKIAGRDIFHIVGSGKSIGPFDWFFKVRDRYETFVDVDGVFPWLFVRNVSEGGYKIKQTYKFAQTKNKVDNGEGKTFEAPAGVQDMLSSFYYARAIDYSKAKENEVFTIWSFVDDELWPLKIRFLKRETIKVGGKKYKAMKFCPVVQEGRLFKDEDDVSVWISDDENKIPLLAQGKIFVGSIKFELTSASGLASPLAKVE